MPVIDRKPKSVDNDDEHHKKLMHRQGKNDPNNDTSHVFVSISIGSTVVVQCEDRRPWTYATIVGKGAHNHNNRSYKIQATTTGRIITCNRQHIKPKPIIAEYNMCYHASKHTKQIHSMPFWTIFGKIHIHTQTKLFLMKGMTVKIHMVNMGLKTIYKAADKNRQGKYVLVQGWSMKIKTKGKHC